MGILASGLFILLLLIIGFVYNNWTLSFIIFGLTSTFAILLAQSNIEEIMKHWPQRRCDLEIMVSAQLYKPKDDMRTSGEFAAENFTFCTKKTFQTIINTLLIPVFMLINQQLDVAEAVNEMLNRIRIMITNLFDGFQKILDPFFKRFRMTGNAFAINQMKFLSAMGRAFGISQAVLYLGMSLVTSIENFVQFVIRVIMIIMYIILGLMILIWFMILPVFALIIITCQVIGNSPFGYMVEDVCGEMCFDPKTLIRGKDGKVKKLGECRLGDTLQDGTVIEGILKVKGEKEQMYTLDGILVSGSHLVWHDEADEWIPVKEHPDAVPSFQRCPILICLRTSTRNIPLVGLQKEWLFRDWEELPLELPTSDAVWDFLVSELLNEKAPTQTPPQEIPLLKPSCQVMFQTGEFRTLAEVSIGDLIYSSKGFTKITGIYHGQAEFSECFTDGIWFQEEGEPTWNHPKGTAGDKKGWKAEGIHLTTESGSFWMQSKNLSGFVRDFTEVGSENLPLTYNFTRKLLKKSFSREESCVSDSLSQVLLSSWQPIC